MDTNMLTKSDLNFVLSRCPRDVTRLLKDNPGTLFLAGGFIRSVIAGEKPSDIDLFGTTHGDLLRIAKDLTWERKGRYFETKNAITVLSHPRFPVQFITRWLFTDPIALVKSFDFTICQAVIWIEAGYFKSVISPAFYSDLAARRLCYNFPQRQEEAGGSLMRVIKFLKKGYTIQAPSLAGVVARLMLACDFEEAILENEREAWMAQVITGLLREVDPLIVVDGVDFLDEHEVQAHEI